MSDREDQRELRRQLDRIRYLSNLANRANVNAGVLARMPDAIPAVCTNKRCGFHWTGRDAICAPSLENVRCFWCGSKLAQITPPPQGDLFAARSRSQGKE